MTYRQTDRQPHCATQDAALATSPVSERRQSVSLRHAVQAIQSVQHAVQAIQSVQHAVQAIQSVQHAVQAIQS